MLVVFMFILAGLVQLLSAWMQKGQSSQPVFFCLSMMYFGLAAMNASKL